MVNNNVAFSNDSDKNESSENAQETMLKLWGNVPEERRGETIAMLLDKTRGWHEMAISPQFAITWLACQFQKANISVPPELEKHIQ